MSADTSSATIHTVVNVTATVQGGSGGTVTFLDGGAAVVAVPLSGRGTAVLSIASLSQGSHRMSARYVPAAGGAGVLSGETVVTVQGLATGIVPFADSSLIIANRTFGFHVGGLPVDAGGSFTFSEAGSVLATTTAPGAAGVVPYQAFGDSITAGHLLTSLETQRYADLVATSHGLALTDLATAGDLTCDTMTTRMLAAGVTGATQTVVPLYSYMTGTNDADNFGVGGYEANFKACHQAALAWLGVPREYKVLAGDAGLTLTGVWQHTTSATDGTYQTLYNNSGVGTLRFQVGSSGAPIYLWYLIRDQLAGTFTVAVDGVATGESYSTQPAYPIGSNNPLGSAGFALLRLTADPGAHEVVVTVGSGSVGILGVGTAPSGGSASVHPLVLAAELPAQLAAGPLASPATQAAYNQDIQDDIALMRSDGLDVRYTPTRAFMQGSPAEMFDAVHPNALGNAHLAAALEATLAGVTTLGATNYVSVPDFFVYLTLPGVGVHTIDTAYSGDGTYAGTTVSTTLTVVPRLATTMALTVTSANNLVGTPVLLSGVVTPAQATGVIGFSDGSQALGSSLAVNGAYQMTAQLGTGTHSLMAYYTGDPTYAPSSQGVTGVEIRPIQSVVALGPLPASTSYGTAVGLTAKVTPAGAAGTVVFQDSFGGGTTVVGQGTLTGGVAMASVGNLQPGTHLITAVYGGDTNDAGSTSGVGTTTVTVVPTTLTMAPIAGVTYGGAMVVSASVAPVAAGTVTFVDKGTLVSAVGTLDGTGVATVRLTGLTPGTHTFVASFGGDATHAGAVSQEATGVVSAATTVTALTVGQAVVTAGSAVTFTVNVTPSAATGTALLRDGNGTTVGQVRLVLGVGTVSTNGLSTGNDVITASYGGDGNFSGSASGAVAVQVVPAVSTTVATVGAASVMAGMPAMVTVQVTGAAGVVPTGTVTLGAATAGLVNGVARFGVATPALGTFTVVATYGGDGVYAGSAAAGVGYTVLADATKGSVGASAGQVAVTMPVGLTATFTSAAGVPAGVVTFKAAGVVVGTAGLDGAGQARVVWVPGTPGSYGVTATLSGTGVFGGSDATGGTVVVTAPLTLATGVTMDVAAGGSGMANVGVTPLSGFQGAMTVSCSSPVSYVTCAVDAPGTLTGATNVTVKVSVAAKVGMGLLLATPLMLGWRRRRLLLRGVVLAGLLAVAGCAAGSSSGSSGLPGGSQVVLVTATAAGVTATTQVTVVIGK